MRGTGKEGLEGLAKNSGFAEIEHALELAGVCADCLPTATEGEKFRAARRPTSQPLAARVETEGFRTAVARCG
jgi:hypothetical protein